MATPSRKSLGRLGEQLAAEHLERLGWRIVERNYQTRLGELDLVAVAGDTLVFVEVKTCRAGRGRPWDSLHERKQVQVRRIAGLWFNQRRGAPFFGHVRFDGIGVVVDAQDRLVGLDHLEGAF
jgi:putative endonuclease